MLSTEVAAALAAGNPAEAVLAFVGGSHPGLQQSPWWPAMVQNAATLPHDLALVGDGAVPVERFARIAIPTLVVAGGDSEQWALDAVDAVVAAVPRSTRHVIDGQGHGVTDEVLAPVLEEFFG